MKFFNLIASTKDMLLYLLIGILVVAFLLLLFQHKLIYHPTPYDQHVLDSFADRVISLDFETDQGKQVAFYYPPEKLPEAPPEELWLFFSGNAALALDWLNLIEERGSDKSGYLLIEYPGFGICEGQASPATILTNTEEALIALAKKLNCFREDLTKNLSLLGHSLGAATALQFASHVPTKKIILLAPFTSMLNMACRTVGWPLCHILTHRYDNVARLAELFEKDNKPVVTLLHGTADRVIPVKMSRKLYDIYKPELSYHELEGTDHMSILDDGRGIIYKAMDE